MKKNFLVAALVMLMGISATFANTNKDIVNEKISSAFQKEFAGASEVNWENSKTFAKATFRINEQVMFAFYAQDGHLLAVTRNIVSGQLPLNLQADLKKYYADYWITDLFEMAADSETNYYLTIQNSTQTVVLKSSGTTGWTVFKKEKKEI
ncbi:MAG: hypothetical protein P0Y53_04345 [Candidatus Pseudobacter hemicellulosilyticus]|uniref:Beta-lactamase-inhibitor-like PepSY-like domain-containing protein n=1 Tax=Candidatus Pseudobacter hemicellulosilyticus TaxID=3121375 RepID=A0AAJ6BIC3_9BACT|nr:MAG: hypothetical protein P0Y53_04345 [Pseudobacter sp.]